MTRAQRKMKRGKIDKGNSQAKVNKASMKAMMEKETTLKFDKELVKINPFKVRRKFQKLHLIFFRNWTSQTEAFYQAQDRRESGNRKKYTRHKWDEN